MMTGEGRAALPRCRYFMKNQSKMMIGIGTPKSHNRMLRVI